MKSTGQPFEVALQVTRAGNLFTTHTPVEAGFDRFTPNLIWQYLGHYAENQLGLSYRDFMALGRQDPDDDREPFNMAYLALHGSGAVNGVSQLHGRVSRSIFQPLFPRWPQDEVPIGHVTNGIHVSTWDSKASDELWTKHCGKERWLGETDQIEEIDAPGVRPGIMGHAPGLPARVGGLCPPALCPPAWLESGFA